MEACRDSAQFGKRARRDRSARNVLGSGRRKHGLFKRRAADCGLRPDTAAPAAVRCAPGSLWRHEKPVSWQTPCASVRPGPHRHRRDIAPDPMRGPHRVVPRPVVARRGHQDRAGLAAAAAGRAVPQQGHPAPAHGPMPDATSIRARSVLPPAQRWSYPQLAPASAIAPTW